MHHRRVGDNGPHFPHPEARSGGMVVVPVGCRDRAEQFPRALSTLLRLALGKDGDDLYLGVERDAGDLLLDQERVVDTGTRLPDAPPRPSRHRQGGGYADSHERCLPRLSGAHPQVAPQTDQGRDPQDDHRVDIGLLVTDLVGVRGVPGLGHGPFVGLFEVALRPVGSEGPKHQPRHDALVLVQIGQSAEQGDDGV